MTNKKDSVIYVTRPNLPPLAEFIPYLEKIWERHILTNGGPFHQQLESELAEFLGVKHVALFNNATIALIVALRSLRIHGEVITTPFSFVATSHALKWNNITPVFIDIDPNTLNLDPAKIEAAITDKTTAILPVHCYGQPANVAAIKLIADKYGLKVVYDAAHAFGVGDNRGSILNFGDLSVLSFHATKVFNTFEGGAIICHTQEMKDHIDRLKNFGHDGEISVIETGINGKMSEINAAFGLLQLQHINSAIKERGRIDAAYRKAFEAVVGIECLKPAPGISNYAYFPVLVNEDFPLSRDELYDHLRRNGIHPRRYFYPLISEFPMYRDLQSANRLNLPVAASAADRILCLPIYPDLDDLAVKCIVDLIAEQK